MTPNNFYFRETLDSWKTHCTLVEDIDMNIEKMVRRWEQFETDLASHDKWINEISKRSWNKKNTLNNIEKIVEQRNTCKRNCNEIKTYQKHIEDFFTTANNLEEISGSTNVKTSMNRIQNE